MEELSKEEKLRRRQERLAQWKSKKATAAPAQAPQSAPQPPAENTPANAPEPTADARKAERLRKLAEWKRRKQAEPSAAAEAPGAAAPLRLGALKIKTALPPPSRSAHKRNVFGAEDAAEAPRFKVPRTEPGGGGGFGGARARAPEAEVDELDAFLASLQEDTVAAADAEAPESASEPSDGEDELLSAKMRSLQKGKQLAEVDHASVEYLPFEKNFYVEDAEIGALSDADVKALRLELDGIKVSGHHAPRPFWDWAQLGLPAPVRQLMDDKLAYAKPTAIQSQALPAIMAGRDFLGIAKTGSGKTLAFVLPLLRHVQAQPPLARGDGPVAVLLAPTRELAIQIYKQLSLFTAALGVSACCCYGGSSIEPQIADLKKGSQVVVATPGRMIDLLAANNGRVCNLRRTTYVVLDEADRMFDFGFEPQIRKIFSQIRPDRQSILFSATFAKKMESLARSLLRDPVEVVVGAISVVAPEVTQHVAFFDDGAGQEAPLDARKFERLVELLRAYGAVKKLVFVEKQDAADRLMVQLLGQQIPCVAVHGGKEQVDRKYALRDFSAAASGVDVLIATSVAARGLDVKGLDLVVNYDPANHMEDYVHRVGRTGRAGNKGDAWTFVAASQERPIADLAKALRLSKVPEERIDPRVFTIADAFFARVKAGQDKYRFGFGGKGLQRLDEARSTTQSMERRAYNVEDTARSVEPGTPSEAGTALGSGAGSGAMGSGAGSGAGGPESPRVPEFTVIEGAAEETAGPDRCKFHARITINDLPQKARWVVVSADNLGPIIEATSTSITNKGQFYAANSKIPKTIRKGGKDVPPPPKLYLLVEGLTENSVAEACRLIRQKMIEGLEQASAEENAGGPGKYTV